MAVLPKLHPLLAALDAVESNDPPRDYLGFSQAGHPCSRYLQYCHTMAFSNHISARGQRIFETGHRLEEMIVSTLRTFHEFIIDDQQTVIEVPDLPHWKGHSDGLIWYKNKQYTLEIKTSNNRGFVDTRKKGVRMAKPQHYSQMQAYMMPENMPDTCWYLMINKDTSEFYAETVEKDVEFTETMRGRLFDIITSDKLLPKIGNGSATWHECKFCDAQEVCHEGVIPRTNCRTCKYVAPENGGWTCGIANTRPLFDAQGLPCEIANTRLESMTACQDYSLDREYFDVD